MRNFDHIANPVHRNRAMSYEIRGAFQGYIGDFAVYQSGGSTHGYHLDNKTIFPNYTGSENGLYTFAGRKPFEVSRRF